MCKLVCDVINIVYLKENYILRDIFGVNLITWTGTTYRTSVTEVSTNTEG
jgi:hypothetical protein